jgi:TRAP-type C4-dicarboxylate transport system permease small subunit
VISVKAQGDVKRAARGLSRGLALAHGVNLARDLGNLPGNVCTPEHLAITALSKRLSFKGQKILDIFVQAMVILFCVVVMIGGGTRLVNTAADQLSAALQLPMPLIYASVPVGAILFIFYALIFIGEDLRDMKQGPKAESAKEA